MAQSQNTDPEDTEFDNEFDDEEFDTALSDYVTSLDQSTAVQQCHVGDTDEFDDNGVTDSYIAEFDESTLPPVSSGQVARVGQPAPHQPATHQAAPEEAISSSPQGVAASHRPASEDAKHNSYSVANENEKLPPQEPSKRTVKSKVSFDSKTEVKLSSDCVFSDDDQLECNSHKLSDETQSSMNIDKTKEVDQNVSRIDIAAGKGATFNIDESRGIVSSTLNTDDPSLVDVKKALDHLEMLYTNFGPLTTFRIE